MLLNQHDYHFASIFVPFCGAGSDLLSTPTQTLAGASFLDFGFGCRVTALRPRAFALTISVVFIVFRWSDAEATRYLH